MNLQKYLDLEALTKLRRDLHQHPELGFEEIRTSRIVADYLLELGLEVEEGIAETGYQFAYLSANTWDVSAAGNFGFNSVWVNRKKNIFDNLDYKPITEIKNLSDLNNIL